MTVLAPEGAPPSVKHPYPAREAALRNLAGRIVGEARQAGAGASKLSAHEHDTLRAVMVDGVVTEAGSSTLTTVRLELWHEGRSGSAILTGPAPDPAELVAMAMDQAALAPRSDRDPLPFAELMAWDARDPGLFNPSPLAIAQAVARIEQTQRRIFDHAAPYRVASIRGGMSASRTIEINANSLGLMLSRVLTTYSVNCDAALVRNGKVVPGLWHASTRDLTNLIDPLALADRVLARAFAKFDATSLASGIYRAVLEPPIAAQFAEQLLAAIGGRMVSNRASWLAGKRGEQITAPWLDIDEDPWQPGGLNSTYFDRDGYRTQPRRLVEQGVLLMYLHDRWSATAMGETPTGHSGGVCNVKFRAPAERVLTPAQLRHRLGDGLVISETFGIGFDLAAGRFSLGAVGRRIVQGEDAGAVDRFMIHGHFTDLFTNIEAMGDDTEERGNIRVGSLLISALAVSGDQEEQAA